MATSVLFQDQFEIPLNLTSLGDFRRWAVSDAFPETGRIDLVGDRIEVDMSPEDLHSHGKVKTELIRVLSQLVKDTELGELYTDSARVVSQQADLSAEPDIVLITEEALDTGRVRLVPRVSGEPDRYIEIEGAPNCIVEIVSDSSAKKDTERLPQAYFNAGVQEYWIIDARTDALVFQVYRRGEVKFQAISNDDDGFQYSSIFQCSFRLDRSRNRSGRIAFDLLVKK